MVRTVKPRALGRLGQPVVGPFLICCAIQMVFFMSCHRTQPAADIQGQNTLKERVKALQHEPLGPVDLGNAIAAPTENTEYIIERKEQAVPLLIDALKENGKPVLVGYAAYCLRRIGSDKGKDTAASLYKKLSSRGEEISLEERFARSELKKYLDFLNEGKS